MTRLLLLTNAAAGTADDETVAAAREILERQAEVEVHATASIDELTDVLAGRGDAEVVVVGGDGSLHAALTALCREGAFEEGAERTTLGLVPLGTGNDFARAVGLPIDPAEAAEIVLSSPARPMDVIVDDDRNIVANAVHLGVGELAGRAARPWKERLGTVRLGILGYVIGAVRAGVGEKGWKLRVVVDGREIADGSRRVLQVAIANGTSVGGGTELAPDAEPGDGLADVVISYATSPLARLRYGFRLTRGTHTELDDVLELRGREVRVIATTRPYGINADGEVGHPIADRTWRVVPGAYLLHVPEVPAC